MTARKIARELFMNGMAIIHQPTGLFVSFSAKKTAEPPSETHYF
jgi:hypothetical protein